MLHPDVLIYIQNVRNYLNNNESMKSYFIGNNDEIKFYELLTETAKLNFEKRNEPQLHSFQFEIIRLTLIQMNYIENELDEENNFIKEYKPKKNIKIQIK